MECLLSVTSAENSDDIRQYPILSFFVSFYHQNLQRIMHVINANICRGGNFEYDKEEDFEYTC